MQFLKSTDLSLNPAKYLVANDKPVTHAAFVEQQRRAEYIVRLSEAITGKTFKAGKLDNLEEIKAAVRKAMNGSATTYVDAPKKPTSPVKEELTKFALDFHNYEGEKARTEQINNFMQQFNAINDVEMVGDYFSEGVVKLSRIYTTAEILAAVTNTISILGEL